MFLTEQQEDQALRESHPLYKEWCEKGEGGEEDELARGEEKWEQENQR